ncbi:unnamed protein product [Rhizoctonia solani]|uniref:Palmitoyltransferase n=2 Tax=Rhizoctonia solani TaxID=456999 RepID=A0A8H2WAE4_9AGAM|nr:unnamed protein product [Rhizoctonia solani]
MQKMRPSDGPPLSLDFNYGHFIRFLFYVDVACSYHFAMISMRAWYAMNASGFWQGPSTSELVFMILNYAACTPVLLLVGGFSLYHFYCLASNQTTIEGWEKDKVATLVRKGKIREVKFPYHLGAGRNVRAILGEQVWLWCWPQRMRGSGVSFPVADGTDPETQFEWPPKDPNVYKDRNIASATALQKRLQGSPWTYGNEGFNPALRMRVANNHPPYHPSYQAEGPSDESIHPEIDAGRQFDHEYDSVSTSSSPSRASSEYDVDMSADRDVRMRRGSEGWEVRPMTNEEIVQRYARSRGLETITRPEPEPDEDEPEDEGEPLDHNSVGEGTGVPVSPPKYNVYVPEDPDSSEDEALGSSDPDLAAQAAQVVIQDVAGIDLNCGCPKPFSVHAGMGAALLSTPDLLCGILSKLRSTIPPNVPLSAKIRLLADAEATRALVSRIWREGGISALTVHCRTREMRPATPAVTSRMREAVDQIAELEAEDKTGRRVAVIYNGDCPGALAAQEMKDRTGATSVMMARAAEANPSCFDPSRPVRDAELEIMPEYLRLAKYLDNHFSNTKFCVQQFNSPTTPESSQALPKAARKAFHQRISQAKNYDMLESALPGGGGLGSGEDIMNKIKETMRHRVINAQKHRENVNDRFGVEGVEGVEVDDEGLGEDKLEAPVESPLESSTPREVPSRVKVAAA